MFGTGKTPGPASIPLDYDVRRDRLSINSARPLDSAGWSEDHNIWRLDGLTRKDISEKMAMGNYRVVFSILCLVMFQLDFHIFRLLKLRARRLAVDTARIFEANGWCTFAGQPWGSVRTG